MKATVAEEAVVNQFGAFFSKLFQKVAQDLKSKMRFIEVEVIYDWHDIPALSGLGCTKGAVNLFGDRTCSGSPFV